MSFRDLKRVARRDLHSRLQIAANYYEAAGIAPRLIGVRLTTREITANEGSGRQGLAAVENVDPKLIFMLDECDPAQGAVVSLEIDEAYRVLAVDPPDDITVTAQATRLVADDAARYAPPVASG